MAKSQKLTPVERLMQAMDWCSITRAEANWTNGYRAGKGRDAEQKLYEKEVAQWAAYEKAEKKFERLVRRVLWEARNG